MNKQQQIILIYNHQEYQIQFKYINKLNIQKWEQLIGEGRTSYTQKQNEMFKKSTKFHLPWIDNRSPLSKNQFPGQDNIRQQRKRHGQHFSRIQCLNLKQIVLKYHDLRSQPIKISVYKPKLIEKLKFAKLYQSINSIPFQQKSRTYGQYCLRELIRYQICHILKNPGIIIQKNYQKKIIKNRKSKAPAKSNSRQYVKQGFNKKLQFSFHEKDDESGSNILKMLDLALMIIKVSIKNNLRYYQILYQARKTQYKTLNKYNQIKFDKDDKLNYKYTLMQQNIIIHQDLNNKQLRNPKLVQVEA